MKYCVSPIVRTVFAAALLCLPVAAAWARGDASASVARHEAEAVAPTPGLANQIDVLLDVRFAALRGIAAPEARVRGLKDLSQFAAITVEGLIDASPRGEMRELMDARLRPILARHQHRIAEALAALGERPAQSAHAPIAADFPHVANAP